MTHRIPHDTCWQCAPYSAGGYRPWLIDRGSLTQRIEARSPGMKVKVIFEGRRPLHRDERFLSIGNDLAWTRDVVLYCGAVPVVYAHSVLQPGGRGAGWRLMRGMGSRPLGAALFFDPRIRRLVLRQHKLGRGHELDRHVMRHVNVRGPLWARRSLFMVGKSPILVTEVFLPGVLAL